MSDPGNDIIIRTPQPGEYGWIAYVHGQFYAEKFGWGEDFERIVANIMAEYLNIVPSQRQACFVAEREGRPVGCIMLMEKSESEGKLRILYVSERERGRGVATRLVNTLMDKAREIGYSVISLRTTNNQIEARQLYKKFGFKKISSIPNTSFAKGSFDEEWRLEL